MLAHRLYPHTGQRPATDSRTNVVRNRDSCLARLASVRDCIGDYHMYLDWLFLAQHDSLQLDGRDPETERESTLPAHSKRSDALHSGA